MQLPKGKGGIHADRCKRKRRSSNRIVSYLLNKAEDGRVIADTKSPRWQRDAGKGIFSLYFIFMKILFFY